MPSLYSLPGRTKELQDQIDAEEDETKGAKPKWSARPAAPWSNLSVFGGRVWRETLHVSPPPPPPLPSSQAASSEVDRGQLLVSGRPASSTGVVPGDAPAEEANTSSSQRTASSSLAHMALQMQKFCMGQANKMGMTTFVGDKRAPGPGETDQHRAGSDVQPTYPRTDEDGPIYTASFSDLNLENQIHWSGAYGNSANHW